MDVKKINKLFTNDLVAINMGLESFADNLKKEGVRAIQVNWKPPAGGNARMVALLAKLGR
ncbi:MAG TPA: fdrA domain protein [Spirochaetales bacterium]|nr:fdrA domain protein [Spirochaetales bacterium]